MLLSVHAFSLSNLWGLCRTLNNEGNVLHWFFNAQHTSHVFTCGENKTITIWIIFSLLHNNVLPSTDVIKKSQDNKSFKKGFLHVYFICIHACLPLQKHPSVSSCSNAAHCSNYTSFLSITNPKNKQSSSSVPLHVKR